MKKEMNERIKWQIKNINPEEFSINSKRIKMGN